MRKVLDFFKTLTLSNITLVLFVVGAYLIGKGLVKMSNNVSNTMAFDYSVASRKTSKPDMLTTKEVIKLEPTDSQIIKLYGEVDNVSAKYVVDAINKKQSESAIVLFINSPGGSVLDGGFIISAMESSAVPVYTVCVQICASMAAIIHQYGNQRLMFDRSILMFHPASGQAQGQIDNMVNRLSVIQRYVDKFDVYVANRAGMAYKDFKNETLTELWIDGSDSVTRHFADKLVYISSEQITNGNSTEQNKAQQEANILFERWKQSLGVNSGNN